MLFISKMCCYSAHLKNKRQIRDQNRTWYLTCLDEFCHFKFIIIVVIIHFHIAFQFLLKLAKFNIFVGTVFNVIDEIGHY